LHFQRNFAILSSVYMEMKHRRIPMSRLMRMLITVFLLVLSAPVLAQNELPAGGDAVTTQAADSSTLNGMFWVARGTTPTPGVLLVGDTDRWQPLIQPLQDAGYAVLVGNLHNPSDGPSAETLEGDIQTWLGWLAEQPGVRSHG